MDARSVSVVISVATTGAQAVALFYIWRSKAYKTYPALAAYLTLQILSAMTYGVLPWGPSWISVADRSKYYFWCYWSTYLVSAGLLLLTIQSLFREMMSPLPGLTRLGTLAFRWVICISILLCVGTSYMPAAMSKFPLVVVAGELMRFVSVLELCLLAFVLLVGHKVGLSHRSRSFGIALGFGLMACGDFLHSALAFNTLNMFTNLDNYLDLSLLVAVGAWAFYFARPEPARVAVTLPLSSPLLRWNEISLALGKASAQLAPAPAQEFFLSDVEKVVDRVLVKNSLKAMGS